MSGSRLGLFDYLDRKQPDLLVTLPKGLAVCRKIIHWWEHELQQAGFKFLFLRKIMISEILPLGFTFMKKIHPQ